MMKLIGVLLLLGVLDITFAREHKKGGNINSDYTKEELTWIQPLRDQGYSEEDIAGLVAEARIEGAAAIAAADEGDIIPWSEARGYEECEEFMIRGKKKSGKEKPGRKVDKPFNHRGRKRVPKPKSIEALCEMYECPKFDKIEPAGCGFGARRIKAAKWVSTELDISDHTENSDNMESSFMTSFFRLFGYLNGANDQGAKISMTIPVITQWYMNESFETVGASLHFYIPEDFQENTPVPTDELVEVQEWDEIIIYHRTFGGDDQDKETYKREFENLATALTNEDVDFYPYIAITGGFTRPGYGRQRQEVMYLEWSI